MKRHLKSPQHVVHIFVRSLSARATRGILTCANLRLPCALGRSGHRALKREGDGATPIGSFALRHVFYRPDRVCRPRTRLPVSRISLKTAGAMILATATTTGRSSILIRHRPSAFGATTISTMWSSSWGTTMSRAKSSPAVPSSCTSLRRAWRRRKDASRFDGTILSGCSKWCRRARGSALRREDKQKATRNRMAIRA